MNKNWLIRTKNNHILGPISKEKVRELIINDFIKGDDEICSGNGYWFFIREQDLIDKYVLGSERQSFNPVSEAETVLAINEPEPVDNETDIPEADREDLEYPNDDEIGNLTVVGGVNIAKLQELNLSEQTDPDLSVIVELPQEDVDGLDDDKKNELGDNLVNESIQKEDQHSVKKIFQISSAEKLSKKERVDLSPPKSIFNDKVLYALIFIFFSVALGAFYYRKRIIRKFIETSYIMSPVTIAHAQIKDGIISKKKV